MNIGFIGLGHMGMPMMENLIKGGHTLYVNDLSPEAMMKAKAMGAKTCDKISDLTISSNVVFTMLQTGEQVKSVCLGDMGIFKHASDNLVYIDSSSINIQDSRELHQLAKEQGLSMLDAPVSGGEVGAKSKMLTFMVGGDKTTFDRMQPLLSEMGKNIIHAGVPGCGQAAKICNNMVLGISMIAVSEAFTLAKSLDLAPQKLFEIMSNSSGSCWSLVTNCPEPDIIETVPSSNDYKPGFSAMMMLKDLNLSQKAARIGNTKTSLGEHATSIYQDFVDSGFGEMDFSGIITSISNEK